MGLTQEGWLNLKRAGKLWTGSNLDWEYPGRPVQKPKQLNAVYFCLSLSLFFFFPFSFIYLLHLMHELSLVLEGKMKHSA